MRTTLPLLLVLAILFIGQSCQNNTPSETDVDTPATDSAIPAADSTVVDEPVVPPSPPPLPRVPLAPLEVYFLDQPARPIDNGIPGKTYTASVYVLDNSKNELNGPYRGCFYPNSTSNSDNATPWNTSNLEIHLFNNLYGHKSGTTEGLNIVDENGDRFCPGFAPDGLDTMLQYVNVHHGQSDYGNYNSRGSHGCGTLHPSDVAAFFNNFDFSGGFTGSSTGVVAIYRAEEAVLQEMINELEQVVQAPGMLSGAPAPDTSTALATIRKLMQEKYQRGKEKLDDRQGAPALDQQTGCRACDTRFLARLSAKRELDTDQFSTFLCIDQEECDRNVEFTQFYNEVLYRVATEKPEAFLKNLKASNKALPRLRKYLQNPIHERMDFKKVRAALSAANKANRGIYRAELRALLESR